MGNRQLNIKHISTRVTVEQQYKSCQKMYFFLYVRGKEKSAKIVANFFFLKNLKMKLGSIKERILFSKKDLACINVS